MRRPTDSSQLQLVGAANPYGVRDHSARSEVIAANRAAASADPLPPKMSADDPRWILAARARAQLEGSLLSPERRERLLRLATQLGLRSFDANVIIALVQDDARRGAAPTETIDRLALVKPAAQRRTGASDLARWVTAIAAALVATAFLVRWIVTG